MGRKISSRKVQRRTPEIYKLKLNQPEKLETGHDILFDAATIISQAQGFGHVLLEKQLNYS